jgi:hypothetical protein
MAILGKDADVISHWHHPIANFQTSPLEFYAAVELALKPKQIPDYSVCRVDWREGGVLTARREYLRVQRGKVAFDICAAPFGTDFFFSSWLIDLPPTHGLLYAFFILLAVPVAFGVLQQVFGVIIAFFLTIIGFPLLLMLLGYAVRKGNAGAEAEDAILATPLFGWLYERIFKPITYYKTDTAIMFQSVVHAVVLEVVEQLMSAKGMRPLTELERKPMMREFYQR